MAYLTEANRSKLDGIVQQMIGNGESEDSINAVVGDFKQKYSEPPVDWRTIMASPEFRKGQTEPFLGAAKSLGHQAYQGLRAGAALGGAYLPGLPDSTAPQGTGEQAGADVVTAAQLAQLGEGLAGMAATKIASRATSPPPLPRSATGGAPSIGPLAKFLIRRVPGGKTATDLYELASKLSPPPEAPTVAPPTRGPIGPSTLDPQFRGPVSPVSPLNVSPYSASGGTVEVPPLPAQPTAPTGPSLDELTAGQTGGRYKKFSTAPADVQKNIVVLHNRLGGAQPTPKPVPTTAAPPVVAPPPGMPDAAPAISQPLGKTAPLDRETNLVNMLRANTTRKNLEIGQYFTGKGMTPDAVAQMPEAEFNAHVRNVKNASGKPYEASTGRNYHRTFEQARDEVVAAMQQMKATPVAPPPPPQ